MYHFDESLLRYETGKVSNFIRTWCSGRERILNVITVPYNSSNPFMEAIMHCVEEGKRIMYITGETEGNINIINLIRRNTNFRDYSYVRNFREKLSSRLVICSIEKADFVETPFDLYIYDDIGSLSEAVPVRTLEYLLNRGGAFSKLICWSSEGLFKGTREIIIPARNSGCPLAEPRIILTRLDLGSEMPLTAFQFIEWSINCNRRVIIYLPDGEKVRRVQNYMNKYMNGTKGMTMSYIKNETSTKTVLNFMALKKTVMITDDCSETFADCRDTDILVCFADNNAFSAKKLFYLLSRVGRRNEGRSGEAIFLAAETTYDMEKAKNMARDFNKEAWEIGLLKT